MNLTLEEVRLIIDAVQMDFEYGTEGQRRTLERLRAMRRLLEIQ